MAGPHLQLLLAPDAEARPLLERAVDPARVVPARVGAPRLEGHLWSNAASPQALPAQRWGLVVPRGRSAWACDRLAPLIARRAEDMGIEPRDVRVFEVDAAAVDTDAKAARWRRTHFAQEREDDASLPRYLLLVGDLDEVPLALQSQLGLQGFAGRLCFDRDEDYRRYAHKVLRWEDRTDGPQRGRALLHTVHDGSSAVAQGHRVMIAPAHRMLAELQASGQLASAELQTGGDPGFGPDLDAFVAAARESPRTVLFSLSHGRGAPRGGWPSEQARRDRQGALAFGRDTLAAADLKDQPFLPGGLWVLFACLGGGTPQRSGYAHWFARLDDAQPLVAHALRSLSPERPFVAALPKQVLANEHGPLGVVAHVDLAWSYSFQDLDGDHTLGRPARFMRLVRDLVRGDRLGVGLSEVTQALASINSQLSGLADAAALGMAPGPRTAHLWLLRRELQNHILLGDPAVRLPLGQRAVARADSGRPATRSVAQLFGFGVASPPPAPAGPPPSPVGLERLVLQAILAPGEVVSLAGQAGLPVERFRELVDLYRSAGLGALRGEIGR